MWLIHDGGSGHLLFRFNDHAVVFNQRLGPSLTKRCPCAQLLEQHWVKVVEPVVEVQPQELVSCSHGLRALVDAVEARVLGDLQTGIAAVFVQARAFCQSLLAIPLY